MAEVVDAIIADLIIRNVDQYEQGFQRATLAHDRFYSSTAKLKGQTFDLAAEGQKYKQGTNAIGQAEEQLTQRVTRTRKSRADAAAASDEREVASAKKSAKAKADAEIAEAERSARYRAIADRAADRVGSRQSGRRSGGSSLGRLSQAEPSGQRPIPLAVLNGGADAEVAAQKEVNALVVDEIKLRDALTYADTKDAAIITEKLGAMRLERQLLAQGVSEEEIALVLEERRLKVAERRVLVNKAGSSRGGFGGANEFALQASGGRFGYSFGAGAIAGLAATAGIAISAAAIKSATDYADALREVSQQATIGVEALQVYHRSAEDNGASTKDFDSAITHLADQLAKARSGSRDAQKVFDALGISIKGTASAGDLLPTFVDRLSRVSDQSLRTAAEVQAFGESGEKLDQMLSGGVDKINNLAAGLQATGQVLSSSDLANLDEISKKMHEVNTEMQTSVAEVVSRNKDAIIGLADSFGYLVSKAQQGADALSDFLKTGTAYYALTAALGSGVAGTFARDPSLPNVNPAAGGVAGAVAGGVLGGNAHPGILAGVQGGAPNLAALRNLNAGAGRGGGRGRGGASAESLEREAEQRTKQFNDRMASFEDRQLQAQESMTGSVQEQAAIENQIGQRKLQQELADIESQRKQNLTRKGVDAALENQRAAALRDAAIKTEQAESDAREQEVAARFSQEQERTYEDKLSADRESIDARQALARTDKDRLRLALDSLAKEQEAERARLQNEIDTAKPGTDVSAMQHRLDALPQTYADRAKALQQQYGGPWGNFVNGLPKTAGEIEESFEQAAVNGVGRLNDSLGDSISQMLKLHGVAGEFLKDLIQIGLHAVEADLFGAGARGSSGGGGIGGILGGIGKLFGLGGGGVIPQVGGDWGEWGEGAATSLPDFGSLLSGLPGFASGGGGIIGGNGGVDRNVLSLNGKPVARVGRGEMLSITPPNVAASNQRVAASAPQNVVVVQPIHADFSGARTDEQTMRQFMDYADARSAQAYKAAVQTSGGQVPGILQRQQTLKS